MASQVRCDAAFNMSQQAPHTMKIMHSAYLSAFHFGKDIICANQLKSKFLSLPLKSCQDISQGNQLFNFYKGK